MNIYEKIQQVRVELQNLGLNKSGKNKFAGYTYFELSDFLPAINQLCKDHKLMTHISFTREEATLTIINAEAPDEKVIYTSPMYEAVLKGAHPIQNAGAVITYQRRYLMMLAFEIVECDALDSTQGKGVPRETIKPDSSQNKNVPRETIKGDVSSKQLQEMYSLGKQAGYDHEAVDGMIFKKFKLKPEELGKAHYEVVMEGFRKVLNK